jgi:hypothetical protein
MKKLLIMFALQFILTPLFCQTMEKNTTPADVHLKVAAEAPDKGDRNNNFYDNEETYTLTPLDIEVSGEVENPGKVDFSKLTKRSVIVKETLLNEDGTNSFVGAYRYDGYSLFDILNERILNKKNKEEFRPIIDLYVEIENAKGEKVIVSWGEIYYPNVMHNSIIATEVMRIVPSKSKDLWPLPQQSRLVIASDLITERNISQPVKITVRSWSQSFKVDRDISPLYTSTFKFFNGKAMPVDYSKVPSKLQTETIEGIFYGRGRGIHTTQPWCGVYMKDFFKGSVPFNRNNLMKGVFVFVGLDGYRSVYTYSEIMNRSDQSEVLLVPTEKEADGGKFRVYPSCDFFSDRAVKALSEIHFGIL